MKKVADVSGISIKTLAHIVEWRGPAKKQQKLHIDTIRKILNMERIYAIHIKRYTHWPAKWDRSPRIHKYFQDPNDPFKLYPVKVIGRPADIKALDLLATVDPAEVKDDRGYNRRKRDYARRGRKTSQSWAKRIASGWNWHEAREKIKAGRPYYNMGRKKAVDRGLPAESAPNRLNYKSQKRRNDNDQE